jgi:chemotaxis signal transduction protein
VTESPVTMESGAAAPAVAAPTLRACLCGLGGSFFAVDVRSAREVAVFDGFTIVPRAAPCLVGVANLRGVIMPILDIRPLLGLPAHRAGTVVTGIVVEGAHVRAAIAIDAALGLEPFGDGIAPDQPGYLLSFLPRGDELIPLLDVSKILSALTFELEQAGQAQGSSIERPRHLQEDHDAA